MKTFSDLQDIKPTLSVCVDGVIMHYDLHCTLMFKCDANVHIDGFEVLPKYQYLCYENYLHIDQPFYVWLHHVTGQGWLLDPY
jgi:hypothetical protein